MAFTIPEGLFEPIVMSFRLTNSLAIFQTMINEILRNLINIRKVVSFINNVIIEIETDEGHNELVEKVVRRLVENNLYIKSEKCKWQVKEVGFLEVVTGLKRIKMEKDEGGFGLANYTRS